nr:hypothetical protein [Desulfobulbaceae bacterium]
MTTSKPTEQTAPLPTKPVSDDAILKVAKEVVIKFIEVGRLSPANFAETFQEIYSSIRTTVKETSK